MLLALNKPFGVLSQFTPDQPGQRTLAEFGFPPGVYPVGRLDLDSEGLLLLSDEPGLNTRLLDPSSAHPRHYWAQVEGIPSEAVLRSLSDGVVIGGTRTRPARAWILDPRPDVVPRVPPIRVRQNIPDAWIALELTEGKNRQVRRMTAAVGHPTLRLIRVRTRRVRSALPIWPRGAWREVSEAEAQKDFLSGYVQRGGRTSA